MTTSLFPCTNATSARRSRQLSKFSAFSTPCLVLVLYFLLLALPARAQDDRIPALTRQLDSLARFIPGLNHKSDLALSDVPLHDYVRSLGKVHQINLYIDDYPKAIITNDFVNESVKSIFVFLCKKFELSIEPVGTILNFTAYKKQEARAAAPKPRELNVEFADGQLAFDLDNDSLAAVLKKVSRLTGQTIITMPGVAGLLSGYIPAGEFESSLENLLFMNGFALQRHRKGFYMVQQVGGAVPAKAGAKTNPAAGGASAQALSEYSLEIATDTTGLPVIFLSAEDKELETVIRDLFQALEQDYYLLEELVGTTTVRVDGANLDDVLTNLLRGTEYAFKNDNGVYVFGKRGMEGLREIKIVNLKYRPTDKVIELIPSELKEGVELKEFVELNRIIMSGASENLRQIEQVILEIDRPVPMVKIEMVVVDVDFNRMLEAGIKAGLSQPGDTVGAVKSLFPGLDYTLTGTALNTILATSGIPGLANVGALKSNFYLQLQAQETRGLLRVVTRPVISTLNGNEAKLTIGQTQYYRLQTNINSNGAVNAYTQVAQRFETIEINTTITVKPFVSQDGSVTLELKPNFTSPGAQADPNIPPTILTRSFQSIIRVRDGETVVLGGLTRESTSSSSDGLPYLSRVPVFKWFFGKNSRNRSRSSLLIYITPTIEYN
jgi:type IV pilus assembly protein PilQ